MVCFKTSDLSELTILMYNDYFSTNNANLSHEQISYLLNAVNVYLVHGIYVWRAAKTTKLAKSPIIPINYTSPNNGYYFLPSLIHINTILSKVACLWIPISLGQRPKNPHPIRHLNTNDVPELATDTDTSLC